MPLPPRPEIPGISRNQWSLRWFLLDRTVVPGTWVRVWVPTFDDRLANDIVQHALQSRGFNVTEEEVQQTVVEASRLALDIDRAEEDESKRILYSEAIGIVARRIIEEGAVPQEERIPGIEWEEQTFGYHGRWIRLRVPRVTDGDFYPTALINDAWREGEKGLTKEQWQNLLYHAAVGAGRLYGLPQREQRGIYVRERDRLLALAEGYREGEPIKPVEDEPAITEEEPPVLEEEEPPTVEQPPEETEPPVVEPTPTYTITATSGSNGTISPKDRIVIDEGGSQEFIITPDPGCEIADVEVDGESKGVVTSYTFTNVERDHTIHVTFVEEPPVYTPPVEEEADTHGMSLSAFESLKSSLTRFMEGRFLQAGEIEEAFDTMEVEHVGVVEGADVYEIYVEGPDFEGHFTARVRNGTLAAFSVQNWRWK